MKLIELVNNKETISLKYWYTTYFVYNKKDKKFLIKDGSIVHRLKEDTIKFEYLVYPLNADLFNNKKYCNAVIKEFKKQVNQLINKKLVLYEY